MRTAVDTALLVTERVREPLRPRGGHFTQIAFGTVVWAFLADRSMGYVSHLDQDSQFGITLGPKY